MKNKTTINNRMTSLLLLLTVALLSPISAAADEIVPSDVQITAFASFSSQRQPETIDFDAVSAPPDSQARVEAFVPAGVPFPNIGQTQGFASSATAVGNFYGVGVNGFFAPSALPPHDLEASGTHIQSITNNSLDAISLSIDFLIPAPTIQFIGQVGNFFPVGADPARDVTGAVNVNLLTTLTRPDGSTVETIIFDYGMRTARDPATGVLGVIQSRDATGLTRLEEVGFFSSRLPDYERNNVSLGPIGPGETLEISYDYFARASVGFGETGVFAAIGDPFNIMTGGGRFSIRVGDAPPPNPVPEPATMFLLGAGLAGVGAAARRRRQAQR